MLSASHTSGSLLVISLVISEVPWGVSDSQDGVVDGVSRGEASGEHFSGEFLSRTGGEVQPHCRDLKDSDLFIQFFFSIWSPCKQFLLFGRSLLSGIKPQDINLSCMHAASSS